MHSSIKMLTEIRNKFKRWIDTIPSTRAFNLMQQLLYCHFKRKTDSKQKDSPSGHNTTICHFATEEHINDRFFGGYFHLDPLLMSVVDVQLFKGKANFAVYLQ